MAMTMAQALALSPAQLQAQHDISAARSRSATTKALALRVDPPRRRSLPATLPLSDVVDLDHVADVDDTDQEGPTQVPPQLARTGGER